MLRILVAGAALALVAYGVWYGLDQALGRRFVAQVASLGTALATGSIVYLLACRLLEVRELQTLAMLRRTRNG